jgi:hypothetical protein
LKWNGRWRHLPLRHLLRYLFASIDQGILLVLRLEVLMFFSSLSCFKIGYNVFGLGEGGDFHHKG